MNNIRYGCRRILIFPVIFTGLLVWRENYDYVPLQTSVQEKSTVGMTTNVSKSKFLFSKST